MLQQIKRWRSAILPSNHLLVCRPLAILYLILESVRLSEEQKEDGSVVFVVFKSGPHWGRTQAVPSTGSLAFDWEVSHTLCPAGE